MNHIPFFILIFLCKLPLLILDERKIGLLSRYEDLIQVNKHV
jgi:hypothetical protein